MKFNLTFITFLVLLLAGFGSGFAAQPDKVDETALTFEENINIPAIGSKKAAQAVRTAMTELSRRINDAHLSASTERNGEIVCVTVPCADLFRANARELSPSAHIILDKLKPYISRPEQFKVIIAVHSDNSGDQEYLDELTADRANAIDEYFASHYTRELNIIPYGIGSDEPKTNNVTMRNRALNRRVEFYFIPTSAYIAHLQR